MTTDESGPTGRHQNPSETGHAEQAGAPAAQARASKVHRVRIDIERILDNLAEGAAVPAERELAARFAVARETVRHALRDLLVEGRIRRQGRGTVVARPKLVQPLSIGSGAGAARDFGRIPGRVVVSWDDVPADTDTACALELPAGALVMRLERILLTDGDRIGLETTYLSLDRFGWLRAGYDPTTSLSATIRASGIEFASATERIETVLAAPREAALLACGTALPLLLLTRRSRDSAGRPIELVRSLYRGDRVAFEADVRHRMR